MRVLVLPCLLCRWFDRLDPRNKTIVALLGTVPVPDRTIALASLVASKKLLQPGARRGVPTLDGIRAHLPDFLARA